MRHAPVSARTAFRWAWLAGCCCGLGLALTACAGEEPSRELPPESEWPVQVTRFDCPESGDCPEQYLLGDVRLLPSCGGTLAADRVSSRLIGRGATEVRAVEGVDPALFVAVRVRGGFCGSGPATWLPAFLTSRLDGGVAWQEAVCTALVMTDERADANGCGGAAPP